MSTDPEGFDGLAVTQQELAQVFAVSVRTIQRWEDVGLGVARLPGGATPLRYDLAAAVAWRIEEEARRVADLHGGERADFEDARARKEMALAQIREMELAKMRGELLHLDDVERMVANPLSRLRPLMLALPSRIAAELPIPPAEALEIIEPIVHQAMEELSEMGEGEDVEEDPESEPDDAAD